MASNCEEMFMNPNYNIKCRIYLFIFYLFILFSSWRGDALLISSDAQGTALIRSDIQTENVLSLQFSLSMTERISERLHCQMGDCSFMGIVCETPRNMSALSVLKHTKHFCMRYCGTEAIASPICAVAKLYLGPAASSTQGRNNSTDLRRRLPLPNLWYVNVWNIVILRHGSR